MKRAWQWIFRPEPRRFLAVWYSVWLIYSLHGFVVRWLIHQQPIRVGWLTLTGPAETCYLLAEMTVVGAIVWQAWRFERANWRLAFVYEWYSLIEIGLSLLSPRLWTYALNQMWCQPTILFGQTMTPSHSPIVWSGTLTTLVLHLSFVAFYAFMHHGVPLLMLYRVTERRLKVV